MRIVTFLLLIPVCAGAQAKLSPQDESQIRAAIEEQAKKDNQPGGQIWSERGPLTYRVRRIQALTQNVAAADADGVRTGSFPVKRHYTFILTRSHYLWIIARKIAVCDLAGTQDWPPARIMPITEGCTK